MKDFESFVLVIKNYSIDMPSLGEILNSKIGTNGKSKAYIANELGVGEKTIENYMRGLRSPKPDVLVKLSKLLKFDLSQLAEQSVPTATETPQNRQGSKMHVTLTEIGELVKKIQYVTNLTIEQIADRIDFSRPHLTTLIKSGESKKVLDRLKTRFAAELAQAPELTTTTNKPVFDVKSKDTPDKDITIKNLSEVTKSQQDLLAEMSGKLITLVSKVIEKL